MIPRKLLLLLLIAFVVAAGCSLLVYRLVGKKLVDNQPKTTRVVTAVADFKIGTVLRAQDLTTNELGGTIPKGAILKPEDAIGRGVVSNIYQGEPIVESRLAPPGSGGGLAATIKQGMRAMAIKVDDVVGVAGFVTPGMRLDVLVSGNPPDNGNERIRDLGTQVRTLLQNIEVLSAGQDIQKDAEGKPVSVQVVNLLVSPEDAELLTLASAQTKIQLVLRNPLDTVATKPPGSAMAQLFGTPVLPKPVAVAAPKKPAEAKPATFSVEVINGNKHSEATFSSSGSKQ